MALPRRLLALPIAFLLYGAGWLGISHAGGALFAAALVLWTAVYVGIFWGAWVGVPLLGVGATLLQPSLPERWRRPVRVWFVVWLLAWCGVLAGLVVLGPPPGFEAVPL